MPLGLNVQVPRLDRQPDPVVQDLIGAFNKAHQEKVAKETQFLKDMDVDPVVVMGNNLQSQQMKKIESFNNKWASEFENAKGNLSTKQKIQLNQDKNTLMGWQSQQNKALADWDRTFKLVSDPRTGKNFDKQFFESQTADWKRTGNIPQGGFLREAGKDLNTLAGQLAKSYSGLGSKTFDDKKDGKEVKTTVFGGGQFETAEDAKAFADTRVKRDVELAILNDPGFERGAADYFAVLPRETQKKYLDAADINKDGLDDFEKSNAIILAAQDAVMEAGGSGIKVKEDIQTVKATGADKSFKSSSGKSSFSIQKQLSSNFSGSLPGIKITGKETVKVPSQVFTDKEGNPIDIKGEVNFLPSNILVNGTVEGTIIIPRGEREETITKEQYDKIEDIGSLMEYKKKGDKYIRKVKVPQDKITVQTNYSDIEGTMDANFRTMKEKMAEANFEFEKEKHYTLNGNRRTMAQMIANMRANKPYAKKSTDAQLEKEILLKLNKK